MRKTRRGLAIAVALPAAAIALVAAPAASAAPASISAGGLPFDNVFSAPSYDHEPGTTARVTWTGGGPHNVTSFASSGGQPLFSSDNVFLIFPASAQVNGTQFLPPGDYGFYCTVHGLSMSSSLRVTGTPVGPGASPQTPSSGLAAVRKKKCRKGSKLRRGKCVKRKRRKR